MRWFAGEVAWTIFAYTRPGGAPIPSVADIGYFLSYAVALPAILVGLGLGVVRRPRGLLDALLAAAALGAIGWQLVIGPRVPGSWDAAALTTFLYPVLSVSIVSILVAVMVSSRRPAQLSMIIAGAAFGIAAISDAGYTYLVSLHAYPNLSWLSLGWQGEAVLLCVAALVAARRSEGDERLSHAEHDMAILPVLLAFLAVSGLMLADLLSLGGPSDVTLALTVLLFLGVLLRQLIAIRDRTRLAEQLRTDAITDSLTELYNRRFFLEMLQVEARVAARQRTPLSLILLDLDRFKHVNDRYGHSVGDAVLVEAAHRLSGSLREGDLISRYGGEEFVCLLPATGEGEAILAEHVR
jgi:predicted signal transduction protein with EAL and GGDEF domain